MLAIVELINRELWNIFSRNKNTDRWIWGDPIFANKRKLNKMSDERETAICFLIAINS